MEETGSDLDKLGPLMIFASLSMHVSCVCTNGVVCCTTKVLTGYNQCFNKFVLCTGLLKQRAYSLVSALGRQVCTAQTKATGMAKTILQLSPFGFLLR